MGVRAIIQIDVASQNWADNYKLLVGAIVPRPIAFVSTEDAAGNRNLAAFSFFNGVCPKPFILSFAPMRRADGGKKDTLRNIEQTGQFVVNIVSEAIARQMNAASPTPEFPPEVDEWEVSGLTPIASIKVAPARVMESPVHMECELVQVVDLGGDEAGAGSLVLGRVVCAHVREDVMTRGRVDVDALAPIARMAGNEYARVTDRFQMVRPTADSWPKREG